MSGICLELVHLIDAVDDCVSCLRTGPADYNFDSDGDFEDHSVSFTIRSSVDIYPDYIPIPSGSEDYLDTCGHRTSEAYVMSSIRNKEAGLSLDSLLAMTPVVNGADIVKMAARHLFLSHVKSQNNVKETFFPTHKLDDKYETRIDGRWFGFRHFACLFVCQAICKVKDEFQMYTLLDEEKMEDELQALYSSPHWKKIGFSLYTMLFQDLVKDEKTKVSFSAFLDNDRQGWAQRLSERVKQKNWVYTHLIHPVVQGQCTDEQYNRDLNILFIKLHLLDPSTVMSTYDYLRKALPDLNLELVTTNYLGEPLDWTSIKPDVEAALKKPTYPTKNPRLSLNEVEVFYGLEVLEFIMKEAKDRELWTGKEPDNKRVQQLKDRCVIM